MGFNVQMWIVMGSLYFHIYYNFFHYLVKRGLLVSVTCADIGDERHGGDTFSD